MLPCVFFSRSQITSKCGKNKKVAHEAQPRMATGVSELISHLTCVHSITLSKNLFVSKGDYFERPGGTIVLECEMFTPGFRL